MHCSGTTRQTVRVQVRISVERGSGHTVRIRISDNGPGMDDATRSRVFEPFFTTKPVGQGTGLGLSISYSIIERHRGTLQILPRAGGGTLAIIRLPLAGPAAS